VPNLLEEGDIAEGRASMDVWRGETRGEGYDMFFK
jgi:hypothetical protein